MRALKWLTDIATWRWAPTVGLIGATLFYILLVSLVVPGEMGLPGVDAKFVPRGNSGLRGGVNAATSATSDGLDFANQVGSHLDTTPSDPEPPPTRAVSEPTPRRGFSPPLERPEPPPPPPPPPPQVVNVEPPPPAPAPPAEAAPQEAPPPAEAPAPPAAEENTATAAPEPMRETPE